MDEFCDLKTIPSLALAPLPLRSAVKIFSLKGLRRNLHSKDCKRYGIFPGSSHSKYSDMFICIYLTLSWRRYLSYRKQLVVKTPKLSSRLDFCFWIVHGTLIHPSTNRFWWMFAGKLLPQTMFWVVQPTTNIQAFKLLKEQHLKWERIL